MKKYPRIGQIDRTKKGKCCICCEGKSDIKIHIEYSYMRGDDNVIFCHQDCFNKIGRDVNRLVKEQNK